MFLEYVFLVLVAISVFLVMLSLGSIIGGKRRHVKERLNRYTSKYDGTPAVEEDIPVKAVKEVRKGLLMRVSSRLFPEARFNAKAREIIMKARLKINIEELKMILLASTLVTGAVITLLTWNPFLGILGGFLGYRIPFIYAGLKRRSISKKINEQLPEVLTLISNGLRAGLSFSQSIVKSIDDIREPLHSDFSKLVHDTVLGKDLGEALDELAEKADDEDVDMFVTSISINRQVGGNLSEILDTLAHTVRERVKLKGDIKRLTVQSQMSAIVVGMIPLGIFMIIFTLNRDFIEPLYTTPPGYVMLGIAGVMEAIGVFWIITILNKKI